MDKAKLTELIYMAGGVENPAAIAEALLPLFAGAPEGSYFKSTALAARAELCDQLLKTVEVEQLFVPMFDNSTATKQLSLLGERLNRLHRNMSGIYKTAASARQFHPDTCCYRSDIVPELTIDALYELARRSGGKFSRDTRKDGSEKLTAVIYTPFKLNL